MTIKVTSSGLLLLALGLVLWIGHADQLVTVHELLGIVLVFALGVLSYLAARSGASIGVVALAALWGLAAAMFGFAQW